MAAGDAPSTLAELRTDLLEGMKDVTAATAVNTIANRYLNKALQDIHQERWSWAERRSTIRTVEPYTTGTVTIAITSLTTRLAVTGTDTAWATSNTFSVANAVAGYKMTLGGAVMPHLVGTVGGAVSITLDTTTPYMGDDTLTDASYALYQDEYAVSADFDDVIDARFFDEDRKIELVGAKKFLTLYPRNTVRGTPKFATLIELGPSSSVALRKRVLFGPAPDAAYIVPYRYYTTYLAVSATGTLAAGLSSDTDEPIIPMRFRQSIVYKAQELWYSDRRDDSRSQEARGRYETLMLRARAAKGPTDDRPRIVSPAARYLRRARFPYTQVPPRFSGTKFDQMEE